MDEQFKNNQNENQPSFSEQIVYAMFRPSKYAGLLTLKKSRFAGFVAVMVLVLSIVTFAIPTGAVITGFGGFERLFTSVIPAMSVEDGELRIEEPFTMSFNQYNVLIDTDEAAPSDEKLDKVGGYIAVGSQVIRFAVSTGTEVYDYSTVSLSGLLKAGFNNQSLTAMIPSIYIAMFITFLVMCIGFFIKYALIAVVLALLAGLINKRFDLGLGFGELFRLGFYSQSFAMILMNFNDALDSPIPYIVASFISIFVTLQCITNSLMNMVKIKKGPDALH
jgi:hypothetical protein